MAALLVSDHEREYTVGLLRTHWLTGRLTAEEFEARVGEVWRARYAQDLWQALRCLPVGSAPVAQARRSSGTAVAAVIVGALALCLMVFSLGLAFPLALPLSATAWALGRDARRSGPQHSRGAARGGEVLGIIVTSWSVLMLAGCVALVT